MTTLTYPGLPDRIKAVIIDGVVLIVMMILVTDLFSTIQLESTLPRIVAFVCIFVVYDPLLTSVFGGTLGHKLSGIRVKKENDPSTNITFIAAFIRFVCKVSLGWLSLLTVTGNEKRKAIHDFAANSVVIYELK